MGIVRLPGRDGVGLLTSACEREGQLASSDVRRVGQWVAVVPALTVEIVAREGAPHTPADRTRVRRSPPSEGEARRAS